MNIAAKTFKDFVSALKQASSKGFNKPVQINYQHNYFLAELQEGDVFGYKGKLGKLSGEETDYLFDILEDLASWKAEESAMKVDKPEEKEDITIEVVKPTNQVKPESVKPKRTSRKKT